MSSLSVTFLCSHLTNYYVHSSWKPTCKQRSVVAWQEMLSFHSSHLLRLSLLYWAARPCQTAFKDCRNIKLSICNCETEITCFYVDCSIVINTEYSVICFCEVNQMHQNIPVKSVASYHHRVVLRSIYDCKFNLKFYDSIEKSLLKLKILNFTANDWHWRNELKLKHLRFLNHLCADGVMSITRHDPLRRSNRLLVLW